MTDLHGMADDFRLDETLASARRAGQKILDRIQDESRVYRASDWDRAMWHTTTPDITETFNPGSEKKAALPGVDRFASEMFARIYSDADRLDDSDIRLEDQWAVKAHDAATGLPEFRELQSLVNGDPFYSAIGAVTIANEVMKAVPDPEDGQEDPAASDDAAKSMEAIPGGESAAQELHDQADVARANLMDMADQIDPNAIRRAIRKATTEALKDVNESLDANDALGWGSGAGNVKTTPTKDRVAMAKKLREDKSFAHFMKLVGTMRMTALNVQRRKSKRNSSVLTGIELGGDLSQVLPSELMFANMGPAFRAMFLSDLLDESLLQSKWTGKDKSMRGPVVLVVDDSGSMGNEDQRDEMSREAIAKVIVLAAASVCQKQKRDLFVFKHNETIVGRWEFKKGKVDWNQLCSFVDTFVGGGTDWTSVTSEATRLTTIGAWKQADILYVTDGCCRFEESSIRQLATARNRGVIARAILVAGSRHDQAELERACGKGNVVAVSDLFDDTATDMAFGF